MLAQYYKDTQTINIFPNSNSIKIWEFPKGNRKEYGFPPFSKWKRTTWGYELEFIFTVAF